MAAPFSQTMAALRRDAFGRRGWLLGVAALVLALWGVWFFGATIEVVEPTPLARLEIASEPRSIESAVTGEIVSSALVLGRSVGAGEVLVELDARELTLAVAVERARVGALDARMARFAPELRAAELALAHDAKATAAAEGEAAAREREARAAARLADKEHARTRRLFEAGGETERELERAEAELEQRNAEAESRQKELLRRALDGRATQGDRRASLERLRREEVTTLGEIETRRAEIARLEHEIERRRLRAPVRGRLASVTPLHPGQQVSAGASLATLLPDGALEVVAHYAPGAALGRIRSGQSARLRLDAFPATQYGSIPARVRAVAEEARDGRVRVELDVGAAVPSGIVLQHGLPGTLEIEIERASPAVLLWRAAGRMVTGSS
jgi:membrane fusion protein (multidrug efflux system)